LKPLGFDIFRLDLIPNDQLNTTSGYLIRDRRVLIIETGASPSNGVILQGLQALGLSPAAVDAIFVTHIHLDHAGGAGLLMQQCPNARLLVHAKGKPHLVDPTKLINGAREVYGRDFSPMFDPLLAVEEERIQVVTTGDRFALSENRFLEFHEAPGHALHQLIGRDTASEGIFSGDAAGVYYDRLAADFGFALCMPSTTPTQFDPVAMTRTLDRMIALQPKWLYFTHFGKAGPAIQLLEQVKSRVPYFAEDCSRFYAETRSIERLTDFMQQRIVRELKQAGLPDQVPDLATLRFQGELNAKGIAAYVARLEKTGGI